MSFLTTRSARLLSAVLLIQVALVYGFTRPEVKMATQPLKDVPRQFGNWRLVQEAPIEPEVQEVLRADDTLNRTYAATGSPIAANLFVAYFQSQRTGQKPHSPKNCLPGSGWTPTISEFLPVTVPTRAEPIEVNRYIVSKGENKSVVLYWYQSRDRIVASEYRAQFYAIADAIRSNHTDTALVRVVVPVVNNDEKAATDRAIQFVQSFYAPLRQHFPA